MADKNFLSPRGASSPAPAGIIDKAHGFYKAGQFKQVVALCQTVAPDARQFADAQQLLGLALNKLGDAQAAVKHLAQAAELDSANSKLQSSLAGVLAGLGREDEAATAFDAALASDPANTYALYGLGRIAEARGKTKTAIRHFKKVLDHDPQDRQHGAQLRLTQLGARKMPPRTPLSYMRQFYADRARSWRNPVGRSYRGYESFKELLAEHCADGVKRAVLDAGCGSGGLAPDLKQHAATMDGVDLSADMIFWARQQGAYDALSEGELCAYLRDCTAQYDLIVTAAVLIHFSDLKPVFKRIKAALTDGGLWMFTVFNTPDGLSDFSVNDFNMFAHSQSYVLKLAEQFGFQVLNDREVLHEFHGEKPIKARVFCLRA